LLGHGNDRYARTFPAATAGKAGMYKRDAPLICL
jgi:hypothetical protein